MARFRGTAELALQTPDDPQACREALADSMEESERVLTMLKTLMDISEAETGTMKLHIETVSLPELIQGVVDLYDIIAEEKKITVRATVPRACRFAEVPEFSTWRTARLINTRCLADRLRSMRARKTRR
jgi:signal transduction histidine kinase